LIDERLSDGADHLTDHLTSVAGAALAPFATVGAASAAVPVLAAAFVVGAQIAAAAAEGGHCSKGKDQNTIAMFAVR
jgi:hypothetical protein